jgi:hypothetical protein
MLDGFWEIKMTVCFQYAVFFLICKMVQQNIEPIIFKVFSPNFAKSHFYVGCNVE